MSRATREPVVEVAPDSTFGFFELQLEKHKTRRRSKGMLLPSSGSAFGVSGLPWAAAGKDLRSLLGMFAPADQCLMLGLGLDGRWGVARISTEEAATRLRMLLRQLGFERAALEGIGAHSLKVTLLSWLAKAGVDRGVRRILGGHVKPKDRSLVEYSRDELAALCAKLQALFSPFC